MLSSELPNVSEKAGNMSPPRNHRAQYLQYQQRKNENAQCPIMSLKGVLLYPISPERQRDNLSQTSQFSWPLPPRELPQMLYGVVQAHKVCRLEYSKKAWLPFFKKRDYKNVARKGLHFSKLL